MLLVDSVFEYHAASGIRRGILIVAHSTRLAPRFEEAHKATEELAMTDKHVDTQGHTAIGHGRQDDGNTSFQITLARGHSDVTQDFPA